MHGISRLPVREALIELDQKGFVTLVPRRGAFAVDLSVDDIEDHFRVLGMVFGLTAARAAKVLDEAKLVDLRSVHEELVGTSDAEAQELLNREFVATINAVGSSARLAAILRYLSGALLGSFYLVSPAWATTEAKCRELMLAALEARDATAARSVAEGHLRECAEVTVAWLRANGYWQLDRGDDGGEDLLADESNEPLRN